jgi:hypothetical protein
MAFGTGLCSLAYYFRDFLTKHPTSAEAMEIQIAMLLCLSCNHFYQLCPVPEKMEPRRKFARHASYRPEGCAQFEPVKFKKAAKRLSK